MKISTKVFLNELAPHRNKMIRTVTEEPLKKGFYTSQEISKKYKIVHRIAQKMISKLLVEGKLEVEMVRRKLTPIVIRRVPCYKFKRKSYEQGFKGYTKR